MKSTTPRWLATDTSARNATAAADGLAIAALAGAVSVRSSRQSTRLTGSKARLRSRASTSVTSRSTTARSIAVQGRDSTLLGLIATAAQQQPDCRTYQATIKRGQAVPVPRFHANYRDDARQRQAGEVVADTNGARPLGSNFGFLAGDRPQTCRVMCCASRSTTMRSAGRRSIAGIATAIRALIPVAFMPGPDR